MQNTYANPYQFYDPNMPTQQRLSMMENQYRQQYGQQGNYNQPSQNNGMYQGNQYQQPMVLKGRAVTGIDEAKASMIDLDGSLYVFTDLNNGKIYTKQVDLNGRAVLNTYAYEQPELATTSEKSVQAPVIDDTKINALESKLDDMSRKLKEMEDKLNEYESNAANADNQPVRSKSKSDGNGSADVRK